MFGIDIAFNRPWYLMLLFLIPVIWMLSYRSLAGLGNIRRLIALGLRTLVLVLFILALAEAQRQQTSEKLTVIYLLDQSSSIPIEQRYAMLEYVVDDVRAHRNIDREDMAGLIAFGRSAAIEVPPYDDELPLMNQLESTFDMATDATDIAGALKLAQATFPLGTAKRIVLVTDGNENVGNVRASARRLTDAGVGIDVVPIELGSRSEIVVEKLVLPDDVRKGQPLEMRVIVNNLTRGKTAEAGVVPGKLKLLRRSSELGGDDRTLSTLDVKLPPGKSVFTFVQTIEQPDFYEYEARFDPDDMQDDLMQQNNRATAFTHVRGKGHVLLIEDWEHPGEFQELVSQLKDSNIAVTVRNSQQLFTSLATLQRYDSVILANVARSSGDDAAGVTSFSDSQIAMLVRNTEQMGSGLIMLGGERSFGAGGWASTEIEKAMPVDFTVKNKKVKAVGALALLMHASEMAQGNHWQKKVAQEAIKALGPMDYCGLIHYTNSGDDWLWKVGGRGMVRVGDNRDHMLRKLGRMTPGDMPDFDPAMRKALSEFNSLTDASVKHMIVISDGDPSPPTNALLAKFAPDPNKPKDKGIQITTVAIGTHGPAGSSPLQDIAKRTGGKYYVVKSPKALPKIYQREVRRVTRPLVYEKPVQPKIIQGHEIMLGIDDPVAPITKGFVLTTLKENPLVEVSMVSPLPTGAAKNATILATWTYGLGRAVAFTTDAGGQNAHWSEDWPAWENYQRLFSQMVRWSMRPSEEQGKFTVTTDTNNGKVTFVITAQDPDNEFLNHLSFAGTAISPDNSTFDINVTQKAPGRYVGEFNTTQSGSYFLSFSSGPGKAPIRAGVNVPYSAEFRDRETNRALLESLVEFKPNGGKAGKLIEGDMRRGKIDSLLTTDTFRHNLAKAVSSDDTWLIVFASCVFFADVFVRRVSINLDWMKPVWTRVLDGVLGREKQQAPDQRLERLRSRKEAINASMEERRSAARFEPEPDAEVDTSILTDPLSQSDAPARPATPRPQVTPEEDEEEGYTSRLLKAKRKIRDQNDRKDS